MNILFVCENYLPHYGGAEVVFKNLAEGFVKQGHNVALVTRRLKGTKKYEKINGVKVHRVKSLNTRYFFTFTAIPKVLKLAKHADIIQTTTFNGAPPAWLSGKIRKKPVFLTVHEIWVNKWKQVTNLGKLSCFIHNLLEKAIYSLKFTKYLAVSEATRQDILRSKPNMQENKTKTIYNGVDYDFWDPKKFDGKIEGEKIKKKLGIEDKFVYFSWGRPGTSKGFKYLIEAVPRIAQAIPGSILLLMLGSADKHPRQYKQLMKIIKDLKLEEKGQIKIIPSAPYNELGNYLMAADCVVIPSIAEGFGYTTAESCALGRPTVVSNVGPLPEVASGKFTLVEAKNLEAIAEGVVKIKNKEFNETPLKKFLWKDAIESYLQSYKEELK